METPDPGTIAASGPERERALKCMPIVDYLVLGEQPYLEAHECSSCGALYFDRRNACSRCFTTSFGARRLATTGTVRAYTIVHRAAPSVPTPYTSVVIDLDEGGSVKANLLDVTEPAQLTAASRVTLCTFSFGIDDDGVDAISFGFRMEDTGE